MKKSLGFLSLIICLIFVCGILGCVGFDAEKVYAGKVPVAGETSCEAEIENCFLAAEYFEAVEYYETENCSVAAEYYETADYSVKNVTPADKTFVLRKGHEKQIVTQLQGTGLKWTSKNKKIATVSKNGMVKGINTGKTKISVSNGEETVTYRVKVNPQIIVIDAGHQGRGNSELEPIGPGASEKKMKVSSGTQGCVTGLPEYELNLKVAKKLEKALKKEGYNVIMIRTTNDVNIPNSERAKIANKAKADVFIRIHANSSTDSSINGVLTISPTPSNPYCSSIYKESYSLSKYVVDEVSKATGFRNTGVWQTDSMSGINWCKVPVTILEMGYMSNPTEDRNLSKKSYQNKIVKGTVEGINKYLGK